MVFQKSAWGGYNLTFRSPWLLDQSSLDCFCLTWDGSRSIRYLSHVEYPYPFRRYSSSNFEVIRNRAKFSMFLAIKFFLGEPQKFCTLTIKSNTFPITVQNFAAVGRWSSEISQRKTIAKSAPIAIASRQTKYNSLW